MPLIGIKIISWFVLYDKTIRLINDIKTNCHERMCFQGDILITSAQACNNCFDLLHRHSPLTAFKLNIFHLLLVKHVFPSFSRNAKISILSYEILILVP